MKEISSEQYYTHIVQSYREIAKKRADYISGVDLFVRQLLQKNKVSSWLDIGTGNGDRLAQLLESITTTIHVVCLEPSAVMHEEAKRSLGAKADVINGSFEAYCSEQSMRFSMITALWNVIGHVEDPMKFVSDAYRMLDQGGVLIFDANNRYNVRQYGVFTVFRNAITDLMGIGSKGFFNLETDTSNEFTRVYIASPIEIDRACRMAKGANYNIYYLDYTTGKPTTCFEGQMVVTIGKRPSPM